MRVDRVEKKYWTRSSNEFSSKIEDHFQKRRQSTLKINAKKKKLADQRNFCCQSIPDLLHQQLKLGKNPWILLAPASDDHRYITVPMLDVLRKKWRDFQNDDRSNAILEMELMMFKTEKTGHVFTEGIYNHHHYYWWARRRRPGDSLGRNSIWNHNKPVSWQWYFPMSNSVASVDPLVVWCAYLVTYYTTYVVCFLQDALRIILQGFLGIASRF